LRRLEGHGGFFAAARAGRARLHLLIPGARRRSRADRGCAFRLAGLTTFGFVLELFIVEEKLFAGRENELSPAIDAFEYSVLEFHGTFLRRVPGIGGKELRRRLLGKRP
jgi:hypothetical protein